MNSFKKKLKEMGFKRKSPRVFWYDNNGLFYVVSFKIEKGKELPKVGFEVSHAGMFEDGIPVQRCSPVCGWVCISGVRNQAYYEGGKRPEGAFLERMTKDYFSYFKTASDWNVAIKTLQAGKWPRFEGIPPIVDGAGGLVPSWFINDIPGELKVYAEFRAEINRGLEKYGFRYLEDRFLYVRKRGELYDCMFFDFDRLATFFRVRTFVWSDRFGCDEVTAFVALVDYFVPGLIRTADFLRDEGAFDALLEKTSAFTGQFTTPREYVDYINENGNRVAKRRLEKININAL